MSRFVQFGPWTKLSQPEKEALNPWSQADSYQFGGLVSPKCWDDSNAERDAAGQLNRQRSNHLYRQQKKQKDDAGWTGN